MRDAFYGVLAILAGTILLKIFLPWWMIAVIIGVAAVLAIFNWVYEVTGIDPQWKKGLISVLTVLFLLNLISSFTEKKAPWLERAKERRGTYAGYQLTDKIDPRYPESLAMDLYQTEKMLIEYEEMEWARKLGALQEKMAKGEKLGNDDLLIIQSARAKKDELDKKMSDNLLSRKNEAEKNWVESAIQNKNFVYGAVGLGVSLLAAGLLLVAFKSAQGLGKSIIGLGILAILVGLILPAVIQPSAQANNAASVSRPLSGTFKITEGDGANTEENAIPTGIKGGEGWKAYYVREEGEGPVRIRTGSGENDFLEFSEKTFLTDLHGEIGEADIKFIRWKPVKVSVRVFKK